MLLAVASEDLEHAQRTLRDYHDQGLSDAEKAAADIILDFNDDEMTCPACLTTFATAVLAKGPERCPDCGLFLGT